MAEDRVTLAQLRKLVAQRTGEPEEVIQTFLSELFAVATDELKRDGWVRISGLGQFKIQQVAERRSVNVQTGEQILIDGYKKVVFVPEVALKNKVNEPYQHLSAVQIDGTANDKKSDEQQPLQKLGEQADEINDILAELVQMDSAETMEKPEHVSVSTATEQEQLTGQEQPTESERYEYQPSYYDEKVNQPKSRRKIFWRVLLIILLLLFVAYVVVFLLFVKGKGDSVRKQQVEEYIAETINPSDTIDNYTDSDTTATLDTVCQSDTLSNLDTIELHQDDVTEKPIVEKSERKRDLELSDIDYSDTLTVEEVIMGTRMAQMARRNYGSPHFWVYIYEANKEKLKSPNRFPLGMQIVIPRLPDSLVNKNNPKAVERAKQFEKELLGEQ